jgi:hypothetical protein
LTYYLVGPVALVNMIATAVVLVEPSPEREAHYASYLLHFAPMAILFLTIRVLMSALWERDSSAPRLHGFGLGLAMGSWPIYIASLACALLRVPLPHLATPKIARRGMYGWMVVPQLAMVSVLLFGLASRATRELTVEGLLAIGVALVLIFGHAGVFFAVWEGLWLERDKAAGRPASTWLADDSLTDGRLPGEFVRDSAARQNGAGSSAVLPRHQPSPSDGRWQAAGRRPEHG